MPILVHLAAVNNAIPTEAEVELRVRGLKGAKLGGPSGMRAEDLKGWRKEANWEKDPEGKRLELVVRLVQVMFRDRTVPKFIMWEKLCLILKGKREYRYIGLVEVMWKVCSVVDNCRLKSIVVVHNVLCVFIERRGIGTETLEENLGQ